MFSSFSIVVVSYMAKTVIPSLLSHPPIAVIGREEEKSCPTMKRESWRTSSQDCYDNENDYPQGQLLGTLAIWSHPWLETYLIPSQETMATIVIGSQWGDEVRDPSKPAIGLPNPELYWHWAVVGKGKTRRYPLPDCEAVRQSSRWKQCRAHNCRKWSYLLVPRVIPYLGIVSNSGIDDFHLLPSGLINPECINLIGSGTSLLTLLAPLNDGYSLLTVHTNSRILQASW